MVPRPMNGFNRLHELWAVGAVTMEASWLPYDNDNRRRTDTPLTADLTATIDFVHCNGRSHSKYNRKLISKISHIAYRILSVSVA